MGFSLLNPIRQCINIPAQYSVNYGYEYTKLETLFPYDH